jgi:hypothetical protein
MLHGFHDALTTLGRIEGLPLGVFNRHLQEHKERRQDRLQDRPQRQELVGDFVPYRLQIIASVELKIGLKQVDDREIWGTPVVRGRAGFEEQPALGQVSARELVA